MLSLICPWHCSHRGTETGAACLSCPLNFKHTLGCPWQVPPSSLLRKCESLQIARRQKELVWEAVAQPHLPTALLAQRHRDWGCLLVLHPKLQTYLRGFMAGASVIPAPKMRTSADSSQAERASLESCCSASSAHGTAHTEAQRLGLLSCLAPSNFKGILGGPCRGPPAALLPKCERLQIARRQK